MLPNKYRILLNEKVKILYYIVLPRKVWGRRGRDHMVVGFTTTYMQSVPILPLMLWVRISIRARCTTLYDKVCQRLATGWWFSPDPPVSSTNKTEMLLKVALNTNKHTNKPKKVWRYGNGVNRSGSRCVSLVKNPVRGKGDCDNKRNTFMVISNTDIP